MPPLVSSDQERAILEKCLSECKRKLDHFRRIGDEIQRDLAQSDMDRMLDELQRIYRRTGKVIRP